MEALENKEVYSFFGDKIDFKTLNMGLRTVVIKDSLVFYALLTDNFKKTVELSEIDFAVNLTLLFAVFV